MLPVLVNVLTTVVTRRLLDAGRSACSQYKLYLPTGPQRIIAKTHPSS